MPLPRFILRGEYSINAKLLYALLLGRTQLSQKSGWVSEDGDVYVIYTIRQMANDLNRSERTVKAALAELENAGLIIRVRQGWNRANRIFLQLPDEVQLSSRPEGKFCPMDGLESSPCMGQNLPISKKEKKKQIPVRITGGRTPAAVLGSIRIFFFWTVNWLNCNRHIPTSLRTTSTDCRPIWHPAESTMPTITPQFASGWTRTANRSPVKITTIQRPMRKENVCECEPDYGCNR